MSVNVSEVKLIVIPVMQKTAEGDVGSDIALADFSMVSSSEDGCMERDPSPLNSVCFVSPM